MLYKFATSLCLLSILAGCATMSSAPDPLLGSWDYELHNIPRGDPKGVMTIAKDESGYSINMKGHKSDGNDLIDVSVEGNAITGGHFFAEGFKIDVTGTFTENTFEGFIDAEGNVFGMTATKQE